MKMNQSYTFQVRQVDAWFDGEGWYYNNVWNMGEFTTKAKDERKALTRFLRKRGIVFQKNRTRIEFDGDNYTVVDRATGEPLFDALSLYCGYARALPVRKGN